MLINQTTFTPDAASSVIAIPDSASGVLVPVSAEQVAGTMRDGNDLVVILKTGGRIVISDFYDTSNVEARELVLRDPENGAVFEVSLDTDGAMTGVEPRTLSDIAEMFSATPAELAAYEAAYAADADALSDGDHVARLSTQGANGGVNPVFLIGGLAAVGAVAAIVLLSDDDDDENTAQADNNTQDGTEPEAAEAQAAALEKIDAWADDHISDPDAAPSVEDYRVAGVTGVTSDTLIAVNDAVADANRGGADTTVEVQALASPVIAKITAKNKIDAWAEDQSNEDNAPTLADYKDSGVDGVEEANLDAVNDAVAAEDSPVENLQGIVDGVIALDKIADWAEDSEGGDANQEPTVEDYAEAGVEGVTSDNLDAVNAAIAEAERDAADTTAEVQGIVAGVIERDELAEKQAAALSKITDYADDHNTNDPPSVQDYRDAGVTRVTDDNRTDVNADVADLAAEDVDTTAEVQAIVDNVVGLRAGGTVSFESEEFGVDLDLRTGAASAVGGDVGDIDLDRDLKGINNIIGTQFNDIILGNANNNRLEGGDLEDEIYGLAGNDELYGGANDDIIQGGAGDDLLSGGLGADFLGYTIDSNGDRFPHIEAGNDTLIGGPGGDELDGGDGDDTASYADSPRHVNVDLTRSLPQGRGGDAQGDSLIDIENLIGSVGPDRLTGDIKDNVLTGLDGNDTIIGNEGEDTLNGNAGNDRLVGGDGNDTLNGGEGGDRLQGNNGEDKLRGGDGNESGGMLGLFGGGGDDRLMGEEGDDLMRGDAGSDRFFFIDGEIGNDTISDFDPADADEKLVFARSEYADYNALLNSGDLRGTAYSNGVPTSTIIVRDDSTITLNGVRPNAAMNEDNFQFVPDVVVEFYA